jgi:hypothetical protein
LYNGAAGSTQQAMAQTLKLGTLSAQALNNDNAALQASLIGADPKVQLTVANSLWIDQTDGPVLPSFTQTASAVERGLRAAPLIPAELREQFLVEPTVGCEHRSGVQPNRRAR